MGHFEIKYNRFANPHFINPQNFPIILMIYNFLITVVVRI